MDRPRASRAAAARCESPRPGELEARSRRTGARLPPGSPGAAARLPLEPPPSVLASSFLHASSPHAELGHENVHRPVVGFARDPLDPLQIEGEAYEDRHPDARRKGPVVVAGSGADAPSIDV